MMENAFVLRANERGYNKFLSTGDAASYIGGHPEAILTRHSSFNFGPYQGGIQGFGRVRVFGDEVFSGAGCGYNIHRHHNFIICAFVLEGTLTHVNTVGHIDQLKPGDYYAFSAGSGGKHCELNLDSSDVNVVYLWVIPDQLLLTPSYQRSHFDAVTHRNRLVTLVGNADGAVRISQDVKVSRLVSDQAMGVDYSPTSERHGVYTFVLEGQANVNGKPLGRRDSVGVWGAAPVAIQTGEQGADLLIVESVK
jgi:redox-sensitive bicupin YhaK (pirin superfamily)